MFACLAFVAAGSYLQVALGEYGLVRPHAKRHRIKVKGKAAHEANATTASSSLSRRAGLENLAQPFKKKFSPCPRCVAAGPGEVTLYFESEGSKVQMTPELLALRGGLVLKGNHAPTFPDFPNLFHVGVDGVVKRPRLGADTRFAPGLGALLELETAPLRPHAVLSDLLPPLKGFLSELQRPHQSPMPLGPGPDKVLYVGGRQFSRECGAVGKCHMQWTVGLELSMVPKLLELKPGSLAAGLVSQARALCDERAEACRPEYQAAVSLASMVLQQAKSCGSSCTTPKRCMRPWLVRTHFGDIVRHARQAVGDEAIERLPEDVLRVWGGDPDKPILQRFSDYLTFPEMADLGGMAAPAATDAADSGESASGSSEKDQGEAALLQVARKMLSSQSLIEQRLASRACTFSGAATSSLTPRAWLRQMLQGRDLLSDVDSPIAQKHSKSHLVFKSMGAWRMLNGDDRVHLECRTPRLCLGQQSVRGGTAEQIAHVAKEMQGLEASWQA